MAFKIQALRLEELLHSLSKNLDQKRRDRFELAFRSLGYQDDYCRYHYEQFKNEHHLHLLSLKRTLRDGEIENPHYHRIAFEAHCFAFFRALHALIESIPYLLNILIDINKNSEDRNISWQLVVDSPKSMKFSDGITKIKEMRDTESYKELAHIVNISKHRRLVKVDSGVFNHNRSASFCETDFEDKFRNYEIKYLMENIYDDLFPMAIKLIQCFMRADADYST